MEHVVATVRLFDDDTCQTQVIAAGTREECERFAELTVAAPYEGTKNLVAAHLVIRERNEWDVLIAGFEAEDRVKYGRRPS